jgi:hypothetical protein
MAKKPNMPKGAARGTSNHAFFVLNVGPQPAAIATPAGASVPFSLTITDNAAPVSTNGKIFLEGSGPHSVPVLPQNVVVTPGSPANLSLPPGSYVYWFMAQGHGDFTLNEQSANGQHGAWRAYAAPLSEWFHFSVHS